MGEVGRRNAGSGYIWGYLQRRRYYVWVAAVLGVVVGLLLIVSRTLPEYGKNLSLNLGADLIGTIVVLFAIAPFIARGEIRRDSVEDRFKHGEFIRQTADARREILIMELWTDLLQGSYQQRFLDSLGTALRQQVKVRMLLLNPDARAAEQRADDLLQQTNVVANILDNLRILHEFVQDDVPERRRPNIDIRVYSALPPVQLYQADDHVIVSFYPVNITSWNAAQYHTSPDTQLGKFVGDKFEELWEARSTRTLDRFWETTIKVGSGEDQKTYRMRFVTSGHETYVSGQEIVKDNAANGIGGLLVRTVDENVTGESDVRGPYSLVLLDVTSEEHAVAQELFVRKYGYDHDVILKLVKA